MDYVMEDAKKNYIPESKQMRAKLTAELKKLWSQSLKDAFSKVKADKKAGYIKCKAGRPKGSKNKKKNK